MSFWDILWFILISYAFIAYLMLLFNIVADLFRDKELSGFGKAAWMLCLIFVPFLSAVIYLIARGPAMGERHAEAIGRQVEAQNDYIRSVAAPPSGAAQVAEAKSLLDAGTINQAEFETLKQKALA